MAILTRLKNVMLELGVKDQDSGIGYVQVGNYSTPSGTPTWTPLASSKPIAWNTASNAQLVLTDDIEFAILQGQTVNMVVLHNVVGDIGAQTIASLEGVSGVKAWGQMTASYTFEQAGTFVLDTCTISIT